MRAWVDFETPTYNPTDKPLVMRGFDGLALPIDRMAQVVLASTMDDIQAITITWETGKPVEYRVVARSDTHVGGTGRTTRIEGVA